MLRKGKDMQFTVQNRKIKCTKESLIGDNADYIASFNFDSEWDGKIKTARFILNGQYADVILENDQCKIPVKVLKRGYLLVGVFTDIMTTTSCETYINPSIKETNGNVAPPEDDVYAQIIAMLEEIEQSGASQEQIEAAVSKYLTEHPVETMTEEQVQQITSAYIEEHKTELKGDKGDKGDPGEKGADGINGVDGKDGANGMDGSNGADGASAYDIAVANGYIGTETEWLESLKGEPGQAGKDGANGNDGYTPVKGTDYWTSEDIAEIQTYINNQIGGALNGSY